MVSHGGYFLILSSRVARYACKTRPIPQLKIYSSTHKAKQIDLDDVFTSFLSFVGIENKVGKYNKENYI